jgi:hypothetical protein
VQPRALCAKSGPRKQEGHEWGTPPPASCEAQSEHKAQYSVYHGNRQQPPLPGNFGMYEALLGQPGSQPRSQPPRTAPPPRRGSGQTVRSAANHLVTGILQLCGHHELLKESRTAKDVRQGRAGGPSPPLTQGFVENRIYPGTPRRTRTDRHFLIVLRGLDGQESPRACAPAG